MSYKDDKFGPIFPRRTGSASGSAMERKLLDAVGGSESFKKRYVTNADGSVTRLTTKDGHPQFYRDRVRPSAAVRFPYLETGQLEFVSPSALEPTRLEPATWHFLDIDTTAAFLGQISSTAGAQDNDPALEEGQASLAIGYPEPENLVTQETYGATTAMKKLTAAIFPPSLFSGKMRLFMQAQYGAKETTAWPFAVDITGSSALLSYIRGSNSIGLGFWAHSSPGVFVDSEGYFWLIVIANPTGAEYTVTAYPITPGPLATGLATYYRANHASLDETTKTQIEAYIFAGSTITVASPELIGTFAEALHGTLAYGWKWNADGSIASIVTHELLGTGAADYRWQSRTHHVTIARTSGVFSMSAETTVNGEWTDGWGTFNIFVPDVETSTAPLSLRSLKTDASGVMPDFDFTDVEVYGYYVDNIWKPVLMTKEALTGPFPIREWSSSNMEFDSTLDPDTYVALRHQYGGSPAVGDCSYEERNTTSGTDMTVSVEGTAFEGKSYNCSIFRHTKSSSLTGATADNTVNFTSAWIAGAPTNIPPPSGVGGGGGAPDGANGGGLDAWALVIPGGDCEAAYVATWTYDDFASYTHTLRTGQGVGQFYSPLGGYDFTPLAGPPYTNEFFGSYGPADVVTSDGAAPPPYDDHIYCFSKAVHGDEGTPGGSLAGLFDVSISYQFYDRGMYTYTSHGERYAMSEGLIEPESVNYQHRFVGWA
jgi:hypothetical protein